MTIERIPHSGARSEAPLLWRISAIHDSHLVTRVYYLMTKRQAIALFLEEMR